MEIFKASISEKMRKKLLSIRPVIFRNIFKKDYIVGLDIGTRTLKMAQFLKKEDGLYLIKTGLEEIVSARGESPNEEEKLVSLRKLIKGVDPKKSKFIVSINCPRTAIARAAAPCMPRQELMDGIKLEAKNYFSFPTEEAELDFEIVDEVIERGVKKYQVIIAVSSQKTISDCLLLLEKAGIKPVSFVPAAYALQKLAEVSLPKEGLTRCFVDIGGRYAELTILKGKNLVFSRKIMVAGKDFTKAMTSVLASSKGKVELTLDEAEDIKRQIGIPSKTESKMVNDKISTGQILSMLIGPLEQLVNEIERCFDYYREEAGGGKVDSLILFGAGAYLKGISEFISERLGVEAKVGRSLDGLKKEPNAISKEDEDFCRTAAAIGAGLSEAKGVNLLPVKIKKETTLILKRSGLEAVVVGAALVLVLFYIGIKIQLNNFQKNISVAKKELASLQPGLKRVVMSGLLAKEPYWDDVFKELSNIVPSGIYLTELNTEGNMIVMRGVADSSSSEGSLYNFILALEKGIFSNVKLIAINEIAGRAANVFEITCWGDGM